jgi:hypothetical protein
MWLIQHNSVVYYIIFYRGVDITRILVSATTSQDLIDNRYKSMLFLCGTNILVLLSRAIFILFNFNGDELRFVIKLNSNNIKIFGRHAKINRHDFEIW